MNEEIVNIVNSKPMLTKPRFEIIAMVIQSVENGQNN